MAALLQFLDMGGYGDFVWPTYIATAAIMIGLAVQTRRWMRRNKALVDELEVFRRRRAGTADSDEA